jgi:hypothetical protein
MRNGLALRLLPLLTLALVLAQLCVLWKQLPELTEQRNLGIHSCVGQGEASEA